ncbi:MAG: hypothetical protein RIS94_2932 [Pseudomonadota bacterium]|jgi:8-oxo-dGTP diphosphatase
MSNDFGKNSDNALPVLPAAIPVVALALVDSSGRVLMQRRPAHKQHGSLWEFPGGKIEPGEGPRAALVREIAEELALVIGAQDLAEVAFSASEGPPAVLLLLYMTRHWQGEPRCLEPGAEIAWVDASALSALAMPPLDVPLVEALTPILISVTKGLANPVCPT